MKTTVITFAAAFALLGTACSSDSGDNNGAGGGNGSGGSNGMCSASVAAKEANNYSFSSTLKFPPVTVKPDTELTFDWSALTTDFLKHPVDPKADIDQVNMFMWTLTQSELETKLNDDMLAQRDITPGVPVTYYPSGSETSATLFKFTISKNPIMPSDILPYMSATTYDPSKYTYTVMVATGELLGQGTRMIQAFKLDPASTNTKVAVTSSSTSLTYTADMHSLTPTSVPAGTGAITLDWSGITKNALGHEFTPNQITSALVGHYTQTPTELEGDKFLDLDRVAQKLYTGEIAAGSSVSLSSLKTSTGEAFSGIDSTGTWIVALRCGNCRNPAPWYLTVLKPCG